MTIAPAKPCRINAPSRCAQLFSNGKRCRLPALPNSQFCATHSKSDSLAATLTHGLDDFTSAAPINQFLSRLLLLLAEDRISPRRGAVMAYTANLLLRSVSVMEQNAAREADKNPPVIVYDIKIPRPDYGDGAIETPNTPSSARIAAV
jgi:hypothetical protein